MWRFDALASGCAIYGSAGTAFDKSAAGVNVGGMSDAAQRYDYAYNHPLIRDLPEAERRQAAMEALVADAIDEHFIINGDPSAPAGPTRVLGATPGEEQG